MKIIKSSFKIEDPVGLLSGLDMLARIEKAGRTCYKSEYKMTPDSSKKFVKGLIDKGHESVLEHEKITVRIICPRSISHELVRHRIASFSMESSRFCDYSKNRFGNELTFICPSLGFNWDPITTGLYIIWEDSMKQVEQNYFELIAYGATPQEAATVLPNSLKTELVITANIREWRTILKQRTTKAAHPQMREIMIPLLKEFQHKFPVFFDDIIGENK